MKKILFYNHTGQISGAERVLLMILERLDRSRLEPVVLCPASGRLMRMTTDLGIKTVGLDPLAARFSGILLRWCHRRVPLTTILNAVDLKRFQPDSASRQEIRRALKVAEIDMLVGTVGQLTTRKGQHELIQAFAEVALAIPN